MQPIPLSMLTFRQRVRMGDRTLSKDEWSAVQTLQDATDGNIPAVRKLVRQLRKSGKGMEETLAAMKHPKFRGRGLLHMAAWAGRLEMCRFLVEELRLNVNGPGDDGTHTNSKSDRRWAPNTRDNCEIAELLLSRGAYVDPIYESGTPLHIAARNGDVSMLELLLRHQANPNTVAHLFYTPLSYATNASSLKCVELLSKAGADVNAGRPVTTPLLIAATVGSTCCIKCLLEAGADANIADELGRTAAAVAATQGWTKDYAGTPRYTYTSSLVLAMEIDPDDSTLYAKRSICWLGMSEQDKALDDAYTYRTMKMDLSNSCYEQAAALMLVEEYARAFRAIVSALKLDLRSDDVD